MLNLTISSEEDVCLPSTISSSRLTLEEIGALVCLQCPINETRWSDPAFSQILTRLKNEGVVSIRVDQDSPTPALEIEINLKAVGL